jgi:hypothetical protein
VFTSYLYNKHFRINMYIVTAHLRRYIIASASGGICHTFGERP